MTTITNLFSNFDDLTKQKSIIDNPTNYNNDNENLTSESLNQGKNFKNYQINIKNNLEKPSDNLSDIEGFQINTNQEPSLTIQTNNLLKTTDTTSQNQVIQDLQKKYNAAVIEYQNLLKKISDTTSDYINRLSSNNPYLNKYIRWSDPAAGGTTMYVTNQGVAKPITSWDIFTGLWGKNGCPNDKNIVNITIPWNSSYTLEGTKIPTTPSLIVGTPMLANESCGNEGLNVYVDKIITNPNAKYNGCYADNSSSRTMKFIGGTPSISVTIQNGNFSQPVKSNNSYEYITSTTKVPGWNFNGAVLVNNSRAWGYPIPYPNGNQCACIQNTSFIEQTLNLSSGNTSISFMACGRPSTGANPIDIQLNGKTFFSLTPTSNVWTKYSKTFNVTTSGNNIIKFIGKNSSGDKSTAFQGITIGGGTSSNGTYTYDMCKNEAIDGGYKFFALQNVNTDTSKGYCLVSNDSVSATKNGTAYVISNVVTLWESKTNNSGMSSSVTDKGTLSVFNSTGAIIFNTPSDSKLTSGGYIGCYNDKSTRAMTNTSNGKYYPFDTCKKYATDGNYKYYGSQNKDGKNNGWCVASNDLASSRKYGVANNCTKDKSGNYMGGPWSNAIYSVDGKGTYYLILQDDGNMCVYKGSGPNDNQGRIWCSGTNGKQQKANPNYAAAKGKYGKNWIVSGSTLAKGDFIGSTDGSIYLTMQTNGNLVLYTSQNSVNCQKMKDGNTGGGVDANALYELAETGVPSNLGKISRIDENSLLYPYPDSNIGLTNDYNTYTNYSSAGHDIQGASFSNTTIDKCKTACNNMKNCYGFDFDKTNKICYPKDNTMYPKGSRKTNTSIDLYVRKPKLINTPVGISDKIMNIDSNRYEHYPKSNKNITNSYSLENATSAEKKQLGQLETTMNMLSSQLSRLTTKFDTGNQEIQKQSQTNVQGINNYVNDIKNTNVKIKDFDKNNNVDNILNESDIVVLQKNYDYLFWSVIAISTVLISMNVVKNN